MLRKPYLANTLGNFFRPVSCCGTPLALCYGR